ncbi:LCT.2 family protein [Megaselia abdita]
MILAFVALFHLMPGISSDREFPRDFIFGVSTSAYQIEGSWDSDGKGMSSCDYVYHFNPEFIIDGLNSDVSCDSYNKLDMDIKALKMLNVNFYRFSTSWTRILPIGDISFINQKGIDYYNNLINQLIENEIQPFLTMTHWDLPVNISMTDKDFTRHFKNYADVLFKNFGDRVKIWTTFNEPIVNCRADIPIFPETLNPGRNEYDCIENILKAHAIAYRLYERKYKKIYGGKIGITLNSHYYYPLNKRDTSAVERAKQFEIGIFANPIYGTGGFPNIVIDSVGNSSRLRQLNAFWKNYIKGTGDFLSLNYYSSFYAKDVPRPAERVFIADDTGVSLSAGPFTIESKCQYRFSSVPKGLEDALLFIKNEYKNIEVLITENGWCDKSGESKNDNDRVKYMNDHLDAILNATAKGCNVVGYGAWSLMDSFEWFNGFTYKFGLFHIDFHNASLERTPKLSALFYKGVIENRKNQVGLKSFLVFQWRKLIHTAFNRMVSQTGKIVTLLRWRNAMNVNDEMYDLIDSLQSAASEDFNETD